MVIDQRYDSRTILLHWLTALLVVALWCLGQTIDWFPKGVPRSSARSLHIALGLTLACVVSYRIFWRLTSGRRLPRADAGWQGRLATGSHRLLYALVVTTVMFGIANAVIRGDVLFGLVTLPRITVEKAMRDDVGYLHGLLANALLIVACFHAMAAISHVVLKRDEVMRRMLPRESLRATPD